METRQRPDPHSYYEAGDPVLKHLEWKVGVDFETRRLVCTATLIFSGSGMVSLDTRGLTIERVASLMDNSFVWNLDAAEPILGSRLRVELPEGLTGMRIRYSTSPDASGLQWLTPEQTAGKRHPFLFSQGQCLNARSFLPCQDTPGVRFTFHADITVPIELRGLMAARHLIRVNHEGQALEQWQMDNPIPSYLVALAVGNLESHEIGNRSCVWAEPELVAQAAVEFGEVDRMIDAAEQLFGPYLWGRFDILVPPPSFPMGGMENPTLPFVSGTAVTGNRSGVYIIVHELAHAWTGNLVGSHTWDEYWINEGWTTYAELRIMEALYGKDIADLNAALSEREFLRDCDEHRDNPCVLSLVTHTHNIDPDELLSRIAYHRGAQFLQALEQAVGRARFDAFLRQYIEAFKFTSIDTRMFLRFVAQHLPGALEQVRAWEWVYEARMPDDAAPIRSALMDVVVAFASEGAVPSVEVAASWDTHQAALYFELFPRPASPATCRVMLERFKLESRHQHNCDIQAAWLTLALESGEFELVRETLEWFLRTVGRAKFLKPLYQELARRDETREWGRTMFEGNRSFYHHLTRLAITKFFEEKKA